MKHLVLLAIVGFVWTTTATGSRADPLPPPGTDDSEWRFSLTPYVFLPADVSGDSTVAGTTVSFDFDTSDLLDILDFAFAARVEAWKGDFALILDGSYIDLELEGTVTDPGPLGLTEQLDIDVVQYYQDVMASYRVVKEPYNADGDLWTLEVMGGVRYNYLKQEIDVVIGGGPGGAATTLGGSETWIDPMLGARVSAMLSERWTVGLRGDIGGFSINDGADLTWSLTGGFDYRPWEKTSLKFGLRYYSIDYATTRDDGAFAYDIVEYGPYAAFTFNF